MTTTDLATLQRTLNEIERLRVALNDHRDVNFRLGAIYALDTLRSKLVKPEKSR